MKNLKISCVKVVTLGEFLLENHQNHQENHQDVLLLQKITSIGDDDKSLGFWRHYYVFILMIRS